MQPFTFGLAAIVGMTTSIGPCVAPRYIAVVSSTAGRPLGDRMRMLAVFIAGVVLGYWLIATIASLAARALSLSPMLYWALAITLIGSGLIAIQRVDSCDHRDESAPTSFGGLFLLGIGGSLVVSPCCTPMLAALGVMSASAPLDATLSIVAFSLGHLAPLIVAALAAGAFRRLPAAYASATSVVTGGLTVALGCYYAVLA